MRSALGALVFAAFVLISHSASAQTICTGSTPMLYATCGTAGQQIFDCNDIYDFDMMFCNGTKYLSLGLGQGATCTTDDLGKSTWNNSTGADGTGFYEFCNGTHWISTKGGVAMTSGNPVTCLSSERRKQRWNPAASTMQFCDGQYWYTMRPTVVKITASNPAYVIPSYSTGIIISVWGGGGSGGIAATSTTNGNTGGTSSITIGSPINLSLSATGGVGGRAGNAATTPGGGGAGGSGSGTASVTVTTRTGSVGGSTTVQQGGAGGAAYAGGKPGSPAATKGSSKVSKDGGAPGSGGAGDNGNNSSRRGGGGGGGGGYASVYYADTSLAGQTANIVIGAGGNAGNTSAGDGGQGQVTITFW